MPQTVPNKPINGVALPVVARKGRVSLKLIDMLLTYFAAWLA